MSECLKRRKNIEQYLTNVECPKCNLGELEMDGFRTNSGGGLWSTTAYCRVCAWSGVFFFIKEKL
jgi:hypothetical protein